MGNVFQELFDELWSEIREEGAVYKTMEALGPAVADLLMLKYLDFKEPIARRLISLRLLSQYPDQAIGHLRNAAVNANDPRSRTSIALALCALGPCTGEQVKTREDALRMLGEYDASAAFLLTLIAGCQGDPDAIRKATDNLIHSRASTDVKRPAQEIACCMPPITKGSGWILNTGPQPAAADRPDKEGPPGEDANA